MKFVKEDVLKYECDVDDLEVFLENTYLQVAVVERFKKEGNKHGIGSCNFRQLIATAVRIDGGLVLSSRRI